MEKQAPNPWVKIPLSAYESHMRQASVGQLQAVNALMAAQFALGPARTAMVLGVAGDNGLEHAAGHDFRKVYGVDVNRDYLRTCEVRYPDLNGTLECICADLADAAVVLPRAELLIANLLIEYIGCECFRRIVRQVCPHCISCVIQVDAEADAGFVSDSPCRSVFDGLEAVHRRVDESGLVAGLHSAGYRRTGREEVPLPNGKKLVRLDFAVTDTAANGLRNEN